MSNEPSIPEMPSVDEILGQAELLRTDWEQHADDVLGWFLDLEGELLERDVAVRAVAEEFALAELEGLERPGESRAPGLSPLERAERAIVAVVGDHVDPVQQLVTPAGRYVGVLDYAEHGWWYSFDEYNDLAGQQRRGVCAHCVHDAQRDTEPFNRDTGRLGAPPHGGGAAALERPMVRHLVDAHSQTGVVDAIEALGLDPVQVAQDLGRTSGDDELLAEVALQDVGLTQVMDEYDLALEAVLEVVDVPTEVDIRPGATLASGTTIGGSTAWHDGNVSGGANITVGSQTIAVSPQGSGSGLDADTIRGTVPSEIGGYLLDTTALFGPQSTAYDTDDPEVSCSCGSPVCQCQTARNWDIDLTDVDYLWFETEQQTDGTSGLMEGRIQLVPDVAGPPTLETPKTLSSGSFSTEIGGPFFVGDWTGVHTYSIGAEITNGTPTMRTRNRSLYQPRLRSSLA